MGGQQAILSLTLIFGPVISGLAFDHLGVPAPYWIGGLIAALALMVALGALLPEPGTVPAGRNSARQLFLRKETFRRSRKPGA